MQPPPPAPQTLAASAPVRQRLLDQHVHLRRRHVRARDVCDSGSASRIVSLTAASRPRASASRISQLESRMPSKSRRVPGRRRYDFLVISQLFVPERRGSPV